MIPGLEFVHVVADLTQTLLVLVTIGGGYYALKIRPGNIRKEFQSKLGKLQETLDSEKMKSASLAEDNVRLKSSLQVAQMEHRLAVISEVKRHTAEDGSVSTSFRFTEFDMNNEIDREHGIITLPGKRVYVDYQMYRYKADLVLGGVDMTDRATCVLGELFSEEIAPKDSPYRVDDPSSVEEGVWSAFWDLAHDPETCEEKGLECAHAIAPSTELREGHYYTVAASPLGGMHIHCFEEADRKPVYEKLLAHLAH